MEKSEKDQADIFLVLFSMIEKDAKDQADGKCSPLARSPQPSALPSHAASGQGIEDNLSSF